jgi:hypothetical protein
LHVNAWNEIDADAYLLLRPAAMDGGERAPMMAEWVCQHRASDDAALTREAVYHGRVIAIDVPPRARRKRLIALQTDPLTAELLATIDAGWTISECAVFRVTQGTLDASARAALARLREHVIASCAPRLPARASAPDGAQAG